MYCFLSGILAHLLHEAAYLCGPLLFPITALAAPGLSALALPRVGGRYHSPAVDSLGAGLVHSHCRTSMGRARRYSGNGYSECKQPLWCVRR